MESPRDPLHFRNSLFRTRERKRRAGPSRKVQLLRCKNTWMPGALRRPIPAAEQADPKRLGASGTQQIPHAVADHDAVAEGYAEPLVFQTRRSIRPERGMCVHKIGQFFLHGFLMSQLQQDYGLQAPPVHFSSELGRAVDWKRRCQSCGSSQSGGGKSMCQKCGTGFVNSMATLLSLACFSAKRTTRHSCSSPLLGCLTISFSPGCTLIARVIRAPWAFTTNVWAASDIRASTSASLRTISWRRIATRWLRLVPAGRLYWVVCGSGIKIRP